MFGLSDFEEVKLTQAQFQEWLSQATAQRNALARIAEAIIGLKETRLEQKVDRLIGLLEAGVNIPDLGFINAKLDLIQGLIENEGPITQLTRKVEEGLMALKDDFATLQGKFDTMETAVSAVAEDITALKNEIKDANDRANIDLSPLIARAENIEAGLRSAVGSQPGSDPDAVPEPTPTEPPV